MKFQCWCCWEKTDSPKNPLVRVCMGCKDPDLQWIHQICIDRFITSIPSPKRTLEVELMGLSDITAFMNRYTAKKKEPSTKVEDVVQDLRSSDDSDLDTPHRPDFECSDFSDSENKYSPSTVYDNVTYRHSSHGIEDKKLEKTLKKALALYQKDKKKNPIGEIEQGYCCTRCSDPYIVVRQYIHPLKVLINDSFILWMTVVLNACAIISATTATITLIEFHKAIRAMDMSDLINFFSVSNITNILSLGLFGIVYWLALTGIWNHCRARNFKHVLPLEI